MSSQFQIYVADTETTGIDHLTQEILEISFYRINDKAQKTWCLKPEFPERASADALRINGHKIEDIKGQTKEGRERYQDPAKVIVEIENWFMDDGSIPSDRILVGHNSKFDLDFLEALWRKHNASETFPFGDRPFMLDTRQIQLFIDLVQGSKLEYYNLGTLLTKYGIKNAKAHTAAADTFATQQLFLAQCSVFK